MTGYTRSGLLGLGLACCAWAQTPAAQPVPQAGDHSSAYYNFAMGHLYAEMAGAYGNRGEYVNKAIDFYKQAMQLDPSSSYIGEELADLYVQSGQLERATALANDLIKGDPNNADAHKVLARIYSRQIGDPNQPNAKIDQNMLNSALAEYKKITELNPQDTESLSMLARLYRVLRDDANAEKTYRAILAVDPNEDDALTGLAAVFADRGDMKQAIEMLKQAVDKNPDPRTVVTLAEFYEQDKDFSNAADTWQKALPLTNDNVNARRAWANDLMAAGRTDEALKAFTALATDDPKNVELQLRLMDIYERKRDYAGARGALGKARANGNGVEVRFAEAGLLDAEGKTPQAITVLEGILAETKKSSYTDPEKAQRIQALLAVSRLQKKSGKTTEAIASFRQIAELNPQAAAGIEIEIVDTLLLAKDFKAARATGDAALKKYPGDRDVALAHAGMLSGLGQYDPAIAELRAMPNASSDRAIQLSIAQVQEKARRFADEAKTLDAVEAASKTPEEKQAVIFTRGAMFERQKNFDAAEQQFRKVIESDPTNANAMNYLGYMFADRGVRLEEAQQLISKALDLDPGNGAYLDSLGWVHYRQNRLDQAAQELRDALDKIGKEDPTVHEHLGDVYFKQGKVREAIQQWEASVNEMKSASPSEQDPEDLARVSKKLEGAKVRISEKK